MLQFDEETARVLEDAYQGADVSQRRRATFDALAPAPGDRILDLGCGNGLLTLELSRAVGPSGHVTGLDASPQMLDAARQRLQGRANTTLTEGDAARLPFEAASFGKAACLQVFEYLTDRRPALRALHKVLTPGGLLAVGDMHWDTLAWHSDNTNRMARMLEAWSRHMAVRDLPAKLPAEMHSCGFEILKTQPLAVCDTTLRPDGLAMMMIRLIRAYAVDIGATDKDDAAAWAQEQEELAQEGRFFFSLTHFVCTARRL
ncbi:methyltransferase domain-containing protein [Leisingera daeponensis]|uniref:Methyltransferase domain-containing protein n=1 Tax=Leisingera daeponensis TaxID=405746 RepID=A0ABS7NCN5_9RHOB|nr:methyltransferase domain-containing protein [Leisingera daeponensis]MBY6138958.1 methyltransferase domain-containing protein [Leisingera daeponensis]